MAQADIPKQRLLKTSIRLFLSIMEFNIKQEQP